jgi:GNAT superfamily N-acetyltransferase
MSNLVFRKVKKSDLRFLEKIRDADLKELHLERIKNQNKKLVDYIIAFREEDPIGLILITYKNFHAWHKYPALEDLYIEKEERKKGFAKQIMIHAQNIIKKKGFKKACLDVETHEKWIRKFYESLGYKKISGVHDLKYEINGNQVIEKVNYFEKKL